MPAVFSENTHKLSFFQDMRAEAKALTGPLPDDAFKIRFERVFNCRFQ
jgi:hypothetical protein